MRQLLLVTVLLAGCGSAAARGDTLQTLGASQLAAQKLNACFEQNYQPGTDKADSASHKRLLAACATEWDAAADACHEATGNPTAACRKQTGNLADDFLGLKGAGLQQ